ncbi:hypothetical protein M6B38_399950 [Iris pallida]|uniref:Uncharacterized protein n=1 Tax=Iris pallida TaxID=29817 RepID=A0AAX6FT17_IRIPA|nr:hypothetical protein M6B38_399950 [Iris pallida]
MQVHQLKLCTLYFCLVSCSHVGHEIDMIVLCLIDRIVFR